MLTRQEPLHTIQCDGQVESWNKTLPNMQHACTQEHPFEWEMFPRVCMAYNISEHPSTGHTPFFLMFGCQARIPADLMLGTVTPSTNSTEYATALQDTFASTYDQAREQDWSETKSTEGLLYKSVHGGLL